MAFDQCGGETEHDDSEEGLRATGGEGEERVGRRHLRRGGERVGR